MDETTFEETQDGATKHPTLQIDTRQQESKHTLKHEYFKERGVHCVRTKLYVGDYMYVGGTWSVDTKRDIAELKGNLRSKAHDRFVRECANARESGIQLVVLTENEYGIRNLNDLSGWIEPRRAWLKRCTRDNQPARIVGEHLAKTCSTVARRHGVYWDFCAPEEAGRRVLEILDKGMEMLYGI